MAEAFVKDEDQFRCSVCLEPLKEPATIPCGHSYCMSCIGGCWDHQEEKKGEFSCPQCREIFFPRPALKKNTMLAELVEKMKICGGQAGQAATPNAEPKVPCDFCSDGKVKAVKSCLMCQVSLCDTHLQPHNDIPALKKHKLVKAMQLEEVICSQHGSLLQVFCRTDQKCICMLCTMDDHKGHDTVSAAGERTRREGQLGDMQRKFQQRIQEREKELKDVREAVKSHNSLAQKAEKHSEKVFTRLLESIERRRVEVREQIRGQQKVAVSHAERVVEELEEEVSELRRGDAELEQLPHSDNNIHFLQIFHGLETSLECKGLPSIALSTAASFKDLRRSLSAFEKEVEKICERDMKKMYKNLRKIKVVMPPEPKTRQDFLKYSCQLTLDPNTVHPHLSLSEDNRKVRRKEEEEEEEEEEEQQQQQQQQQQEQQYPDHPDRFDSQYQVLCKEGLCGRCYWEVELSAASWGPSREADFLIAVAYKAISRKKSDEDEKTDDSPAPLDVAGGNNAYVGGDNSNKEEDEEEEEDDDEDDCDANDTDVAPAVPATYYDDDDYQYARREPCEFGRNEQSWNLTIGYQYVAHLLTCFYHDGKMIRNDVKVHSSKIGVYLDHRQGVLSFYCVSDTMTLLHIEHTTFTEPLYPGFGVYGEASLKLCV